MKIIQKWLLCILWLLFSPAVLAVQTKTMYETEVPVVSQEARVRAEGLAMALTTVLVKASGNIHIAENPAIKDKLRSAEEWVNEYGYTTRPGSDGGGLRLWVRFDQEGVNSLLRDANVPVWGEERPLIVFWVTNELPGQQKHIVTENQDMDFTGAFKAGAAKRSLPVVFPLMDLTDLAEVNPQSVMSDHFAVLSQAAKRYGGNALLVGRILPAEQGLQMTAILRLKGEQWQWDIAGRNPADIAEALADRMAGILSAHYATEAAAEMPGSMQVTVEGIQGAEDMAALTGYLQQLTSVKSADVMQVLGSSVVLELHLRGPVSAFNREISAGQRLVAGSTEASPAYEWKG